ncbi:hypothetical protein BS78_04G272800 [Paspalum vaginatum]|nr:hypothetical protein BS78_04G272800 [Paspalum vaginatum]
MASGSSARVKAERETPPRGEDERRPLRSSNTSSTATGPLRRAPFRDAGKENHAVAEDTADDSHRRRRTEIEIDDTDDVNADFLRASGCPAPYYPSIDARSRRPSALDLRGRAQEMHEVGGTEQEDLDILRAYRNPASHYPSRLPCAVVLRRRRDVVKADDVEVLGALLSRRRRQPYPGARRQDYRELRVRTGDAHHLRAEREEDDYGTLSEIVTAERCARAVEAPAEVCYAPRNKAGQGTVSHNIVRVDRHRAASTSKWSLVAALRRICAITHSDATEPIAVRQRRQQLLGKIFCWKRS